MRKPPSKELMLHLARFYWEDIKPSTPRAKELSWEYLICWGFYEMYLEGWVTG